MSLFKALITIIYKVPDLPCAVEYYKKLLGVNPNFEMPFYTGFTIGAGFELGIMPLTETDQDRVIGYWEVGPEIDQVFETFTKMGAVVTSPVTHVGENIYVAQLRDPCGNPIGIIHNPHYYNKHLQFKEEKPPE
ncbi:MAG: VOC family protein [Gammaproteobacteria bacterium]